MPLRVSVAGERYYCMYESPLYSVRFTKLLFYFSGDTIPPTVTCPTNLISQSQCGAASGQLTFPLPTGLDNTGTPNVVCSAGNVQLTPQGNLLNGNFPSGTTTITCTATDACGLSGQCQFSATVTGGRFNT